MLCGNVGEEHLRKVSGTLCWPCRCQHSASYWSSVTEREQYWWTPRRKLMAGVDPAAAVKQLQVVRRLEVGEERERQSS